MQDFIVHSIIASIVLTIVINVIPRLFPRATRKAEQKVHEKLERALAENDEGKRSRVKVFFPWKTMLVVSVVLTALMNLTSVFH